MATSLELQERNKVFILAVLNCCRQLPKTDEFRVITKQLIRCSTSVGANYRAACRSRSRAEFFAKLSIVVEEIDESEFWLDLIIGIDSSLFDKIEPLRIEAMELLKIYSKSRKTTGSSKSKNQKIIDQ